jgi:hypothetical protein
MSSRTRCGRDSRRSGGRLLCRMSRWIERGER